MNTAVMQLERCANKGYQAFDMKKVYIMYVIIHVTKNRVITGCVRTMPQGTIPSKLAGAYDILKSGMSI